MLKYKVAFTITGETLFSLLAKTLPLSNLKIEEIPDAEGEAIQAQINQYLKPVLTRAHKRKRKSAINPDAGINKILLSCLADGPHRATEMRAPLKEAGYSPNSVGSRLQKLETHGLVIQHGDGLWSLADQRSAKLQEQHNAT